MKAPARALLFTWPLRRLFAFVLAVMLVAQLAVSAYAWSLAETQLAPELERKAQLAAAAQARLLTRAIARGVPFDQLEGVAESFDALLARNPDIAYVLLKAVDGKVLYRRGAGAEVIEPERFIDSPAALVHRYVDYGAVHVGVDRRFITERTGAPQRDLAVLLLASLLLAFELLLLLVTLNCSAPLRQIVELMTRMAAGDFSRRAATGPGQSLASDLNRIAARINFAYRDVARLAAEPGRRALAAPVLQRLRAAYRFAEGGIGRELDLERVAVVRILTFLAMGAEMLSRPFLPLYAGTLAAPALGLSAPVHGALPLTVFLLGVGLALPFAGPWAQQAGLRRCYLAGALASAAGLACAAFAPGYSALLFARAMGGAGCALMLTACQPGTADPGERARHFKGIAMFVGALMAAETGAPALGGILAEHLGYHAVFVTGAAVSLGAAALAALLLDDRATFSATFGGAAPVLPRRLRLPELARYWRFLTLCVLAGAPARFLHAGVLMLLVPLALSELGNGSAAIGRAMLPYGLAGIVLAPLCARLAARPGTQAPLIALGGLVSAAGLLALMHGAQAGPLMLAVAALGVGQSLGMPARLALDPGSAAVPEHALPALLGAAQLFEWFGAAAGPVAAAMLVAAYGVAHAALVLGVFALAAAVLLMPAWLWLRRAAPVG